MKKLEALGNLNFSGVNSFTMKEKVFKLITESKEPVEMVKETYDPSKPKTMKFRGVFLVSQRKNGNGRIYPHDLLKREVDRFRTEMIDTSRALMELEHSSSSEIDPTRASARTLSLTEDNDVWVGEGIILCSDEKFGIKGTVCGDCLAALTQYGTNWGVSSRALGELNDDGVVEDLHLVCIDTVMNPSIGEMVTTDGNRFVNGILESKQWICNIHGQLVESKIEKMEKRLSKMPNTFIASKKNEAVCAAWNEFIHSIKGM